MNTKEKIVTSAVALFVEQGVVATTTREISARAGVAEGSIYRYFPSKDELAWQIFSDYHQQLAISLEQSLIGQESLNEQVHSLVHCFFTMADKDWLMFRYYLTAQHGYMAKITDEKTPYKVLLSVVNQFMTDKNVTDKNIEIITAMAMGAVHQIALNKIYGRIEGLLLNHLTIASETVCQIVANMNGVRK